jgi:hypothetical protein
MASRGVGFWGETIGCSYTVTEFERWYIDAIRQTQLSLSLVTLHPPPSTLHPPPSTLHPPPSTSPSSDLRLSFSSSHAVKCTGFMVAIIKQDYGSKIQIIRVISSALLIMVAHQLDDVQIINKGTSGTVVLPVVPAPRKNQYKWYCS